MSERYTRKLEKIIKQMLTPLKGIPLNLVIESIANCKIIPFDENNEKDKIILKKLIEVAKIAGKEINKKGILQERPNEVGNDTEQFVINALNEIGYKADIPLTKSGKRKSTGYPDIEFIDNLGNTNYLECKSYNIKNVATTFRSFYLSPSKNFKIIKDAHHFVISFEVFIVGHENGKDIYHCKSWKIMSIEQLEVDVKYEFNSDNARLYSDELILAKGEL